MSFHCSFHLKCIAFIKPWTMTASHSLQYNSIRYHSTEKDPTFSHIDPKTNTATMVDVTPKTPTVRIAIARSTVQLSQQAYTLLKENKMKKGDVFTVAKIAGIQACKQTPMLIPLCHPLLLNKIDFEFELDDGKCQVHAVCIVKTEGKTGVEVEAMVGVSVAACTIFDMCKSVDKGIRILDTFVVLKDGGKSGKYVAV